jgi:hypothetical protein
MVAVSVLAAGASAAEESGAREAMRKVVRRVSAVFMTKIRTKGKDESIIRRMRGETFARFPALFKFLS